MSLAPMTFLGSGRVIRRVSGSMGPTLTTVATALSSRSSKSTRLTSPSMKAANPHCAWFSDSAKDRPKNIMNDIMCVCWHFRFSTPPYIYHTTQQLAINMLFRDQHRGNGGESARLRLSKDGKFSYPSGGNTNRLRIKSKRKQMVSSDGHMVGVDKFLHAFRVFASLPKRYRVLV